MALWFNQNGILHDGIGLVLCDVCPCEDSSSIVSDSGSVASDSCTSSTCVEVACCPGVQIPTVLTVTFTGGTCPGTYSAEWYVDPFSGEGEWSSNDAPITVRLVCQNGGWSLAITQDTYVPSSESCDPFELVFDIVADAFCGTFTLTITG